LLSSGIVCILNKMGKKEVTVGVDGSLYRFHPHFHDLMVEKITQLLDPGLKVISSQYTENSSKYTENSSKYTENSSKYTENSSKCTETS